VLVAAAPISFLGRPFFIVPIWFPFTDEHSMPSLRQTAPVQKSPDTVVDSYTKTQ